MRFSQRLKLCDNTFLIFSHLMTFELNLLTLIMTFHLVNMQILKEGLFLAYFAKPLQQNALYLQGLNTVFIIVYSYLHVVTFDLIIGLNNNLSFGQHANTEGGHVPCFLCKTFAAKCLFLQGLSMVFYDCLHIFALSDL